MTQRKGVFSVPSSLATKYGAVSSDVKSSSQRKENWSSPRNANASKRESSNLRKKPRSTVYNQNQNAKGLWKNSKNAVSTTKFDVT